MEREHRRRHPRPGDREPGEGEPDEPSVQRVERDVHEMVAEGARAPEMILEPVGRLGEGIVLGRPGGLEPYGAEPAEGSQQPIFRYQGLVVPDEAAAEDRKIGERGDHRVAQEREAVGRVVPGDGVEVVGTA